MGEGTNVLANPAAFEEYCASLADRLAAAKTARLEFLNYAVERLQALQELAETLGSTDVAASVAEQLSTAHREIEALGKASSGDPW